MNGEGFSYLDEAFVGGASQDVLGIPGAASYDAAIPAGAAILPGEWDWGRVFNGGDIAGDAEAPAPAAGVQYQPGFWQRVGATLADVVETGAQIVDPAVRAVRQVRSLRDQPAPTDPRRGTPAPPAAGGSLLGLSGFALAAVLLGVVLIWRR